MGRGVLAGGDVLSKYKYVLSPVHETSLLDMGSVELCAERRVGRRVRERLGGCTCTLLPWMVRCFRSHARLSVGFWLLYALRAAGYFWCRGACSACYLGGDLFGSQAPQVVVLEVRGAVALLQRQLGDPHRGGVGGRGALDAVAPPHVSDENTDSLLLLEAGELVAIAGRGLDIDGEGLLGGLAVGHGKEGEDGHCPKHVGPHVNLKMFVCRVE
mmetsp:Transcript_39109/g.124501  ORF Transcript_39109/g.124501 Transcript_39109/m.124501 type:complete len:214 (+) Transcript_39109:555-1196(+)